MSRTKIWMIAVFLLAAAGVVGLFQFAANSYQMEETATQIWDFEHSNETRFSKLNKDQGIRAFTLKRTGEAAWSETYGLEISVAFSEDRQSFSFGPSFEKAQDWTDYKALVFYIKNKGDDGAKSIGRFSQLSIATGEDGVFTAFPQVERYENGWYKVIAEFERFYKNERSGEEEMDLSRVRELQFSIDPVYYSNKEEMTVYMDQVQVVPHRWSEHPQMTTPVLPRPENGVNTTPYVVDVSQSAQWQQFAASVFQGLANRKQGQVYLIWHDGDRFWLDQYQEAGYSIDDSVRMTFADLPGLVNEQFEHEVRGLLLYDEEVFRDETQTVLVNIMTAIAAEENLIPIPEAYAEEWKLPVKFDIRDRWDTLDEAYEWLIDTYPDLSDRGPLAHFHPTLLNVRDYLVAHKILPLFYWQGMSRKTEDLFKEVLFSTGANQPVMGVWNLNHEGPPYGHYSDPPGIGNEHSFMRFLSPFAKYLITIGEPGLPNMSYTSGMKMLTQDWRKGSQLEEPVLDPNKKYVTFNFSDGDNIGYVVPGDVGMSTPRWWRHPDRGDVNITWSLSPILQDLVPGAVTYFYQTATENDSFMTGVSGLGYIVVEHYAEHYENREEILKQFFKTSGEYMKEMSMESASLMMNYQQLEPVQSSSGMKDLKLLIEGMLPNAGALFLDYGRRKTLGYEEANLVVNGVPVFQALTMGAESPKDMAAEIVRHTPAEGPAFTHAFVVNWFNSPDTLKKVAEYLGPEYEIVDGDTLGQLYLQYMKNK